MFEPNHCLICYQTLDGVPSGSGFSTISKELNAVFILRKIFEVPLDSLSDYMVDTEGSNPAEWIRLCDGSGGTCKIMVDKAKKIYKEMLDANRRFRKVKGDIIQFLRRNQRRLKSGGGGFGMEMTNQTRKFVSEHDYSESLVDPFIGGDCQAEKILYSSNIVPEIDDDKLLLKIIKEERYQEEENEQDTFYIEGGDDNDNLEDNGDQSSISSEDDKDPLYTSTLNSTRRRIRTKSSTGVKKEKEVVSHIPGDTCEKGGDGTEQWNCSCGRVYTSSMQLKRHVKEATMEKSCMYGCPLCGKGFRRRWDVKRHLRKTHGEEDTDKVMERVPGKKRRMEVDEEEEAGIQEPEGTGTVSSYKSHTFEEGSEKMEDGTEYWRCSCGKIYLGRETLLKHVKEERGRGNEVDGRGMSWVDCGICGVRFKRRFELNRHMKLKHDLDVKVGTGEVDGGGDREEEGNGRMKRVGRKSEGVEGFEGIHEQGGLVGTEEDGSEQWRCSCGKVYASKEAMCRHVKEKNLDPSKWIGCPYCVKSFKRGSELTRHVNGVHGKKKKGRGMEDVESGVGELKMHQKNECLDALETNEDETVFGDGEMDPENGEEAGEMLMG